METGKKVYLVKNRCSLLTAVDGEAIIYNDANDMYERVNPETLARTPIEWAGGFRSQTGDTFADDAGAWGFRPYGGAAESWSSRHAVTDGSWMNAMWSGMKSSRKRG